MEYIFQILILIMSIVVHEVSHGYAALFLGDQTAKYEGRLTLNPIRHLDPVGSIFLPLFLYLTHSSFFIGWAKPVPYNPYNLRPGRWSEAIVAGAGPLSNIALAIVFGFIVRGAIYFDLNPSFIDISSLIVIVNIILALFNLMPIPPLDGSKLLYSFFPNNFTQFRYFFERTGMVLVILFIIFLWPIIFPIVPVFFHLITGIAI